MAPQRRARASDIGVYALALLVIALPLARGGVEIHLELAALLLCALAAVLIWRDAPAISLGLLGLSLVLVLTALQLLPLPPVAHGLSPAARALFRVALEPLGLYPAPRPLSLDPASTGRALLGSAAGLLAFAGALGVGTTRQRRTLLVRALAAGGVLVALAVLVLALAGLAPALAPRFPFVNPNHLAGFLLLTGFTCLGVALHARGQARLLWLGAFALTGLVVFLSLSRGGIVAFTGGAVLFGALALRRERPGAPSPRWSRLALVGGLASVLGLAAFLALDPVLGELRSVRHASEETKLALWRPALQVVADYPLAGIGRGAFGDVFPAYRTDGERVTFTHLENEWLQPLLDLGVPGGLLLVAAFAGTWLVAARRRDLGWTDVGLLAGTAALAAQNLLDFSLELPGVGLPFVVALGLAARGGWAVSVPPWAVRAGLVAATALGLVGFAVHSLRPAPDDPARSQVAWHPADYFVQAAEGVRLVESGRCSEAMGWLSRAMLLGPSAPEPHLYAARCLAAAGQDVVARREYRLALTFGASGVLEEAARRYPSAEALREIVPDTGEGLRQLGAFLGPTDPEAAASVFRRALEEHLDARALMPLAHTTLALGDEEQAFELARRRTVEVPADPDGWQLTAWILARQGRDEEARAELASGLALAPGAAPLVSALVEVELRAHRPAEASRVAERLVPRNADEVLTKQLLLARVTSAQGRANEAIEMVRSASASRPDDVGLLLLLASYCEAAGRLDDAIAAIEHAAALPGQAEAHLARLSELRSARQAQRSRRMGDTLLRSP